MKSAIVRRKWLQKRKVIMGLKVAKNGGGNKVKLIYHKDVDFDKFKYTFFKSAPWFRRNKYTPSFDSTQCGTGSNKN